MVSIGSAFGSLVSFLTRLTFNLLQYAALFLSLGYSTFLVGKYTNRAIQSRKEVSELVYWRDPKRSVAVLAAIGLVLFLFQRYSFHSVIIYTAFSVLLATIAFRVFKLLEGHFKKSDGSNPYQHYLDLEVTIPQDKLQSHVEKVVDHAVFIFKEMRRIFLVENLVDSVKFGLLLYSLTYVANWFSTFGLIILFVVAIFSGPKIYELYKEPIDKYIKIAKEQIEQISNTAQEKLPFMKTAVSEKKEE